MQGQGQRGQRGQHRHVEAEEAGEGGPGDLLAAAQEGQQPLADQRHGGGHLGAHLGGEEGQLVPGQQVPAEAEPQEEKEEHAAAHPGELPRPPVGFEEEGGEHMQGGHQDDQVRRPGVQPPDQPAEAHLGHDELHALESLAGRGPVVEQQKDPGDHLDEEQEQGHAPQVVPDRVLVLGNGLFGGQLVEEVAEAFLVPAAAAGA